MRSLVASVGFFICSGILLGQTATAPQQPPKQVTKPPVAVTQPNVLGKWVGKLQTTPGKGPDGKPLAVPGGQPKVTYQLELRANGTYFTSILGSPDGKTHTSEGVWTWSKNTMVLTVQKRDGKPDTSEPRKRSLTISKDGKTMVTTMQGQIRMQNAKGETVAPPKGYEPPIVSIVFRRA